MNFFSSTAGKSGNGKLNGAFSKDSAQNSDSNFGQEIAGPTGATNWAQKQLQKEHYYGRPGKGP